MLSDSVYQYACSVFADRPTCYLLLAYLWPLVKDYDFSNGDFIVPRPTHLVQNKIVYYGNSTIRDVLKTLGLKPIHLENKSTITIRLNENKNTSPK